ncbi:MAG: bifunctional DNA primase/polymerase [Chloroflexota bacterium]
MLLNQNAGVMSTQAAVAFHAAGYSVIPLHEQSKKSAVSWQPYIDARASAEQIQSWCDADRFASGYGIVTGSVSRLLVIDFDDPALASDFVRYFGVLSKTLVVSTRRGYHYYYRLPAGEVVSSMSMEHIDIQAEGRYVVGARSFVDGFEYRASSVGQFPRELSMDDLTRLRTWWTARAAVSRVGPDELDTARVLEPNLGAVVSHEEAVTWYSRLRLKVGRNNALFSLSCHLRDVGWSEHQVGEALVSIHSQSAPPGGHRRESVQQRCAEAVRSIASAFSRPPRVVSMDGERFGFVPNGVREGFLQCGAGGTARVIEGCFLFDVKPGALVSRLDLVEMLVSCGIGHHSIRQALQCVIDGQPVFRRASPEELAEYSELCQQLDSPPNPPKSTQQANATATQSNTKDTPALVSGYKNRQKLVRRPRQLFVMPSIETLATLFGVVHLGGDAISLGDLCSMERYRAALHHGLIRRRPGRYHRAWLADRLGVKLDSIRRYDRLMGVYVRASYDFTRLDWSRLDMFLPAELELEIEFDPPPGVFLHSEGKDYPLKRGIAAMMIKKGLPVYLAKQVGSHYSVVDERPAGYCVQLRSQLPSVDDGKVAQYWRDLAGGSLAAAVSTVVVDGKSVSSRLIAVEELDSEEIATSAGDHDAWDDLFSRAGVVVETATDWGEAKVWINRVHAYVNERCDQGHGISRGRLYDLVREYGLKHLKRGLAVMQQRGVAGNLAGWLTVYMRSESKVSVLGAV